MRITIIISFLVLLSFTMLYSQDKVETYKKFEVGLTSSYNGESGLKIGGIGRYYFDKNLALEARASTSGTGFYRLGLGFKYDVFDYKYFRIQTGIEGHYCSLKYDGISSLSYKYLELAVPIQVDFKLNDRFILGAGGAFTKRYFQNDPNGNIKPNYFELRTQVLYRF